MKRIVLLLLLAALMLTGCNAPKQTKPEELHLAVILGSHDNAPPPNLDLIAEDVYEACMSQGSVTLVVDDGSPYHQVYHIPAQKEGLSQQKYASIAREQTLQILSSAQNMQALTAEVDTLSALQQAARSLHSVEENVGITRKLILLDSCLSTTGALNFAQEVRLENIDSQAVVDRLAELNEIPDLNGVETEVYTCGDVNGCQTRLSENDRTSLKSIWQAILTAGGADVTMKNDLPVSGQETERSLPAVTPVSVVQDGVDLSVEATREALESGAVINFGEETISFEPGSANLRDRTAAESAVKYAAQYTAEREDFELLICGTTACTKTENYCLQLSRSRAEKSNRLW